MLENLLGHAKTPYFRSCLRKTLSGIFSLYRWNMTYSTVEPIRLGLNGFLLNNVKIRNKLNKTTRKYLPNTFILTQKKKTIKCRMYHRRWIEVFHLPPRLLPMLHRSFSLNAACTIGFTLKYSLTTACVTSGSCDSLRLLCMKLVVWGEHASQQQECARVA